MQRAILLGFNDLSEVEGIAFALIDSASHGGVVGGGIHDQSADQALEDIGLLQSVADGNGIGGTGTLNGVGDPHHTVMAEQALGLHGGVVFFHDLLTESAGLGGAEADTGDIQAAFQSALGLLGQLSGVPTVMPIMTQSMPISRACLAKVAILA